jgi:hypothetical protein
MSIELNKREELKKNYATSHLMEMYEGLEQKEGEIREMMLTDESLLELGKKKLKH